MLKTNILLILCLLFLSSSTLDEGSYIRFRRITIYDGLSLSSVYCIFQDSKGFMWFGTEDGLNRYDGQNFRIFRPGSNDENSISHRWIEHICEDSTGNLWFGSRGGLTRFDPKIEKFTRYIHSADDLNSISNDTITTIIRSGGRYIWIGTLKGLNRMDIQTGTLERFNAQVSELQGLSSRVNKIMPDSLGNLWIATNKGFYIYESEPGNFTKISPNNLKLDNRKILSLLVESDHIWLGTENGLIKYSISDNIGLHYPISSQLYSIAGELSVQDIYPGRDDQIWISGLTGLYTFSKNTGEFDRVI
ncbi:MAG: hypothetical protein JSV24_05415, partial [Bacteroidales bacterium]